MALQTMQLVLTRCAVDRAFLTTLLDSPHEALAEYALAPDEHALLAGARAHSLRDLATAVEAWRRGELAAAPVRQLAFAG
jgi:hypothetical protein